GKGREEEKKKREWKKKRRGRWVGERRKARRSGEEVGGWLDWGGVGKGRILLGGGRLGWGLLAWWGGVWRWGGGVVRWVGLRV
ncbi:hypothetical protein, partial [Dermacoccus nishinomiyaensis]|uniref:hypothetical protein n=1 Tax=Dermacoccus nishinomiyaensis TaxID=1274 RepID=UPI001C930948